MTKTTVAIIGGGISGLSAALAVHKQKVPYVLLEAAERFGGVIRTEARDGFLLEAGPDSMLAQKPEAIALCRELGLGERLVPANREMRAVFVLHRRKLQPLPEGMMLAVPTRILPFLASGLFSWPGKLRMGLDVLIPGKNGHGDESIASFLRRRFGQEAVDRLGEPLLAGIHAGDPERLSILATFPRFRELERVHGSLVRGLWAAPRPKPAPGAKPPAAFYSLRGGLVELVEALVSRLDAGALRTRTSVRRVETAAEGFSLATDVGDPVAARRVIVAAPGPRIAPALEGLLPEAARALGAIPFASSATVLLGYRRGDVAHPLDGYGMVVPATEGLRTTALSFVSTKFPFRAPEGHVLLRGFLGGVRDPGALSLRDDEMIETVVSDMRDVLGLRGAPVLTRVFRWPGGTPQLEVGHLERMRQVEKAVAAVPGLFLTGAGVRSTGIPDSVADGTRAGEAAAAFAAMSRAALVVALLAATPAVAQVPATAQVPVTAQVPAIGNGVAASVVYVQVFRSPFDWSQPWRQEPVSGASGSGFLIDGGRILTNGHVIADARQVLVRRPDQANPYVATVEAKGDDCDLAVLRVADPAFARGLRPLRFGRLPRAGTRVNTYGFPLGGQDVSSTAGIVSRIESRGYVHSGADAHLVVQTDAAINPGNSGGPVVQEGRVAGVAFQGFPGADNMGFFIPVPIVRHFLANLEDGRYDGFPDSGLQSAPLLSPAYRRERGLAEGRSGVVVDRVAPGGTAEGVVSAGDVLLSTQGHEIADDGTIRVGDARVTFEHAIDMLQVGQATRFSVWRDGKELSLEAPARRIARYDRNRNRYAVAPDYVVYAGLVFMRLEVELLKTLGRGWPQTANRDLVWHQLFREAEKPDEADREVVVLTRLLRHAVNSQMALTLPVGVERINGRAIRSLGDVSQAFATNTGRFHTIDFEGDGGIEALERAKAEAAHPEILRQYAIPHDRRP